MTKSTLSVDVSTSRFFGGTSSRLAMQSGIFFAWMFLLGTFLPAQQAKVPVKKTILRLIDSKGNPIAGVEVKPQLINRQLVWPGKKGELADSFASDQSGIVEISHPVAIAGMLFQELMATADHTGFAPLDLRIDLRKSEQDVTTIEMTPGCEMQIVGVDEDGEPLERSFAVLCSGKSSRARWQWSSSGSMQTTSLPEELMQLILVQPHATGQTQFSDVSVVKLQRSLGPQSIELSLEEGWKLVGKVGENVPRPVDRGWVMLCQAVLPAGDIIDDKASSLLWWDRVPLEKDGSFVFSSLPRSGKVHLIAVCDGWISRSDDQSVVGDEFDLSSFVEDGVATGIALQMEKTAGCTIEALDEDGNPLEGATVTFSPNQIVPFVGPMILGKSPQSILDIRNRLGMLDSKEDSAASNLPLPFTGTTDREGRVSFTNLPRNQTGLSFLISAKGKKPIHESVVIPDGETESLKQVTLLRN